MSLRPGPPEALPDGWPLAEASHSAAVSPYRWHVAMLGSGPDMIMLHGAGASAHSWGGLAPILGQSYRVIAPDLPGHGITRGRGMRAGLVDMTTDLLALLAAIGAQPSVLVGHSAGAALALSLAQRLAQPPRAIVVLSGALENFRGLAGVMFPIMARVLALNPFAAPFLARTAQSPGAVERVINGTGTSLPAEAMAPYRHLISDRRHVSGTLAMMASWSLDALTKELQGIDIPTLYLHGARDEAVRPAVAHRAAGAMPRAEIEILDQLGHLIHEEAPDQIAARIESFLAKHAT
ncbi:MAG: alpha/beta fold hydrolase BchO [Pseudomonadota bacterium]